MSTTTILELDQEDLTSRLQNDSMFSGAITVLSQRRGITENDVQVALGALNQQGNKPGVVAIVLMPSLSPETPDAPGPRYFTRYTVQVIDWPAVRRISGSVQLSAETVAERVRVNLHWWATGRGQVLEFESMEPAPMQDETQVSYLVHFRRLGADSGPAKVATVGMSAAGTGYPYTVTLTCSTSGAAIWYTTDGSYPASTNSTALRYSTALTISSAQTLRAAAELSGSTQSDAAQLVFT